MQTEVKGRIAEAWQEQGRHHCELIKGAKSYLLRTENPEIARSLQVGKIVHVRASSDGIIAHLETLGGPQEGCWNPLSDALRWQRSSRNHSLLARQTIIQTVREDLYSEGFFEADTPLLVKGTCPDSNIGSLELEGGYLVTSTEYQIKRLIVGGFEKVFTLTKNFRAKDQGRFHSIEFTMLEWARAYESLHAIEEDALRFIRKAFSRLYPDKHTLHFNGHEIDFMGRPWQRFSVREALEKYLGMKNVADFALEPLAQSAKEANVAIPPQFLADKYSTITYLLDRLQSHLGIETPTFLQEWPKYLTTSAPMSKKDPDAAERSELYIGGVEVADGFPFLTDPHLQRELFLEELERRKAEGIPLVSLDDQYLQALEQGLPPGAGMALGLDRLVMALTGKSSLAEVQAFSWDEL